MHRLKSPFVALLTMLLVAGPLFGQVSQIDPNDAFQITTPTVWERSQGLAENDPTVEFEFHHGIQSGEDQPAPVEQVDDQILLFGEDRVVSLDRGTLTMAWEVVLPFWADSAHRSYVLDGLSSENSRHVIIGNNSVHAMIDIGTGTLEWVQEKPYGEFTSNYDEIGTGLVLFYQETDDFRYVSAHLLNATNGEILSVFPETGRPSIEAFGSFYIAETDYEVFAASSTSGERLWSFPLPNDDADVILAEDIILIHNDQELTGLDTATGQEMWLLYLQPDSWIADNSSTIALVMSEGEVASIDLLTGLELQRMPTLMGDNWQPYLRGDRFLNPDERGIALIDMRTGEEVWRLAGPAGDFNMFSQDLEGQLVIQSDAGTFAVIDATTGDLLWQAEGAVLDSLDWTSILWTSGSDIALSDAKDGSKRWGYTTPEPIGDAHSGYGYVVLITATMIMWLDDETGELVQEKPRMAEWEEIQPAGRLFFVSNTDGVTMYDPASGQQWELRGAMYRNNLGWGSEGDYFTVSFGEYQEEGHFWLFRLSTGELIWDNIAEDETAGLYDSEDGVVFVYDETYAGSGDGTIRRLDPNGTVAWEAHVNGSVTSLSRHEDHGKIVLTLEYGTLVLDETTGETVMLTDISGDPGMNTAPLFYAWVQFAQGRIFEPGMTVSRVYRTADALPEVLKEDTELRGAPNANAVERGTFQAGTEVTRTGNERAGTDDLWLEVTIDGVTGWVPRESLTDAAPSATATPSG